MSIPLGWNAVSLAESPIVPSCPHYPHSASPKTESTGLRIESGFVWIESGAPSINAESPRTESEGLEIQAGGLRFSQEILGFI